MGEFLGLLWGTVILRPYVFIFLAAYLLFATWELGLGRALLYLLVGYLLAWGSEFASIHTGFPYGRYLYLEATRGQELWVLGVPLMDSISYVFLSYASYTLALLFLSPAPNRRRLQLGEDDPLPGSGRTIVLGSLLFVLLDVIIDPVALRGNRWFLGQIYVYPEPGLYFGVPLTNFLGWLIVGVILLYGLQEIRGGFGRHSWMSWGKRDFTGRKLLGPVLYFAVVGFNLIITFYIGEFWLGLVGGVIITPLVILLGVRSFALVRSAKRGGSARPDWKWPDLSEEGG